MTLFIDLTGKTELLQSKQFCQDVIEVLLGKGEYVAAEKVKPAVEHINQAISFVEEEYDFSNVVEFPFSKKVWP